MLFSRKTALLATSGALLAVAASGAPAAANDLPAPWWSSVASTETHSTPINYTTAPGPGSYTSSVSDSNGTGWANVTQGLGIDPFVNVSARGSGTLDAAQNSQVLTQAAANLQYYVEIRGPANVNTVPVNVAAQGYASSTGGNGGASAQLVLGFTYGCPGLGDCNAGVQSPVFNIQSENGSPAQSFTVNNTYTAPVNRLIQVTMEVSATTDPYIYVNGQGQLISDTPGSASAYVDPIFSLPTDLANSGLYSIIMSQQAAPGPAPGGGLLGLVSLLLLGGVSKTRRFWAR